MYAFRGEQTAPISPTATQAQLKAAIELLHSVREITVAYSAGSAACSAAGTVITLTNPRNMGDLPAAAVENGLTLQTLGVQTATCSATQTLEIQTATCTATTGTYTLTANSQTTGAIAFGASGATVRSALVALSSVTDAVVVFSSGVAACSGAGAGIRVTFTKEFGDLADMTAGTAALGNALEVQTLTCTATSGTFTLTFGSQTTGALSYAATALVVQNALETLSTV
jgi:hypothetical protein